MKNNTNIKITHKKPIDAKTRKKAILLVIFSLLSLLIYYGITGMEIPALQFAVMTAYMVAFAAVLIAYIIYNRAFTRKGVTEEMLPDAWSDEEKKEYVEDGKKRIERSSWMLMIIIPLLITFIAEAMYLFVWLGLLEPMISSAR